MVMGAVSVGHVEAAVAKARRLYATGFTRAANIGELSSRREALNPKTP